jgi:hypothetical protein
VAEGLTPQSQYGQNTYTHARRFAEALRNLNTSIREVEGILEEMRAVKM